MAFAGRSRSFDFKLAFMSGDSLDVKIISSNALIESLCIRIVCTFSIALNPPSSNKKSIPFSQ